MANRTIKMSKLKRAFQMLAAKRPQREICEELHMGRGVLAGYKKQADSKGMDYGALGRMSEDTVSQFLNSKPPTAGTAVISVKKKALDELLPDYAGELSHDHHLTILRIHEEYLKDNLGGYRYTQFKKAVRDYQYAHNLSFHNEYIPGEELQIDFAGDPLYITDRKAKATTRTKVILLCCVLPYSGLGYAKAMHDATMDHFFSGIIRRFHLYGRHYPHSKERQHEATVREKHTTFPSYLKIFLCDIGKKNIRIRKYKIDKAGKLSNGEIIIGE